MSPLLMLVESAAQTAANQAALGDGIHFTPVQIIIGGLAGLGGVGTVVGLIDKAKGWGKDKDAGLKAIRDDIVATTRSGQENLERKLTEGNRALEDRMADLHRQTNEDLDALEKRVERQETRSESYLSENKIKSMIGETCEELKHKLNGERGRVDALERYRGQDIERIVRLETNMVAIEKSVGKIEHAVESLSKDLGGRIDGWADKLATSIREIRTVGPK